MPRRNVHLAFAVEGNRGGVHQVAEKRLYVVVGVDLENRHRNFLPARSGEGHIDVAFAVERGIGNRMKVVGNGDRNLNRMRIADVPVGRLVLHDRPRRRSLGHAGHQEIVGTD